MTNMKNGLMHLQAADSTPKSKILEILKSVKSVKSCSLESFEILNWINKSLNTSNGKFVPRPVLIDRVKFDLFSKSRYLTLSSTFCPNQLLES